VGGINKQNKITSINLKMKPKSSKLNLRVIIYSIIALGFLALTVFVDWIFIIGAVVMIGLNQRELFGINSKKIK